MDCRFRVTALAAFAALTVLPLGPSRAQQAPKSPDDYPFDPPEFRLHFQATYFTEKMQELEEQRQYVEAEPYARRALETMSMLPRQELAVAVCKMNLADICLKLNKLQEAEQLYRQCWQTFSARQSIPKGVLNNNDPSALCLFRLAAIYRRMNRYEEAEHLCGQGLNIVEKALGKDHAQVAVGLTVLAEMSRDAGQFDKAEKLLISCVKIREAKLGIKHQDTATSVSNLGDLYVFQRRFRDAEPVLRHLVKIRAERLGPNHVDVADALTSLAELFHLSGRYKEAAMLNKECSRFVWPDSVRTIPAWRPASITWRPTSRRWGCPLRNLCSRAG